jgi:hypothetical protein
MEYSVYLELYHEGDNAYHYVSLYQGAELHTAEAIFTSIADHMPPLEKRDFNLHICEMSSATIIAGSTGNALPVLD